MKPLLVLAALFPFVVGAAEVQPASEPATPRPTTEPTRVVDFQGEYRFLSNFYPATVVYEGITYPDSEHAYQSAKTLDMNERRKIAALATPALAKRAGEALVYRLDAGPFRAGKRRFHADDPARLSRSAA